MYNYTLLYFKIWQQVLAMTVIPAGGILAFIIVLTEFKNLDDASSYILIYTGLGLVILLSLYVLFKQVLIPVQITIHTEGLEIIFIRKTLFYLQHKKYIFFGNVDFVSNDTDLNSGRKFITLKVKGEVGKIILIAPKKSPEAEMYHFTEKLSAAIEKFNGKNKTTAPIKTGSFYTGKFAVALSCVVIVVSIISTIIKLKNPSSIEWYHLLWLYILSASWLANFYFVKKKQSEKDKIVR